MSVLDMSDSYSKPDWHAVFFGSVLPMSVS